MATCELWTHDRLRAKPWRGEPARYKQVKLNGHRFTVFMQPDRRLVGFEREIRPDLEMTVKRPKIVEYGWWRKLAEALPPYSSIDGELHVPGGNAGDAAHATAECSPELEFTPFAVPWWEGHPESDLSLQWAEWVCKQHSLAFAEYAPLGPDDTEKQLIDWALSRKIEGWVLKQANYEGWWKVKPVRSVDCVVTGFKDGRGKYLGLVGSLLVSVWIDDKYVELAAVSGMTDEQRVDIDEERDLGRVVECEYQDIGNGGRLIHPRFGRWRDDKPAEQCRYALEEL